MKRRKGTQLAFPRGRERFLTAGGCEYRLPRPATDADVYSGSKTSDMPKRFRLAGAGRVASDRSISTGVSRDSSSSTFEQVYSGTPLKFVYGVEAS